MPSDGQSFRLDHLSRVKEQIGQLATKAANLGILDELLDALRSVEQQLRTRPLDWGDPQFHTHKQGGRVFRALHPPLIVRYAVFEEEHVVLILDIKPLPSSPLA